MVKLRHILVLVNLRLNWENRLNRLKNNKELEDKVVEITKMFWLNYIKRCGLKEVLAK
jgi:hypothetical protein